MFDVKHSKKLSFPPLAGFSNCLKSCTRDNRQYVAIVGDDSQVHILAYENEDIELVKQLSYSDGNYPRCACWTWDGQYLCVVGRFSLSLYSVDGNFVATCSTSVNYLATDTAICTRRGSATVGLYCIAVSGPNGVDVYEYDAQQGNLKGPLCIHRESYICSVAFSPCGDFLAVAALDGHLGIRYLPPNFGFFDDNSDADQILWTDIIASQRVTSLHFSKNSKYLALVTLDHVLRIYESHSNRSWNLVCLFPYSYLLGERKNFTRITKSLPAMPLVQFISENMLFIADEALFPYVFLKKRLCLLDHLIVDDVSIKGMNSNSIDSLICYSRDRTFLSIEHSALMKMTNYFKEYYFDAGHVIFSIDPFSGTTGVKFVWTEQEIFLEVSFFDNVDSIFKISDIKIDHVQMTESFVSIASDRMFYMYMKSDRRWHVFHHMDSSNLEVADGVIKFTNTTGSQFLLTWLDAEKRWFCHHHSSTICT